MFSPRFKAYFSGVGISSPRIGTRFPEDGTSCPSFRADFYRVETIKMKKSGLQMTSGTFEDHFGFNKSSAVEVLGDEFLDLFGIAFNLTPQPLVVEGTELGNDAVDHRR